MSGVGKKPSLLASRDFAKAFDAVSKQALIDALWCACQLGTDESDEQILTQAARNVQIALYGRNDHISASIKALAANVIDSD